MYGCSICCDCQYNGDKFSFPLPNSLIDVDAENPLLKHYYCCCGDSKFYKQDVSMLGLKQCDCFDEL